MRLLAPHLWSLSPVVESFGVPVSDVETVAEVGREVAPSLPKADDTVVALPRGPLVGQTVVARRAETIL